MTRTNDGTAQEWDAFVRSHPRGHALQLSAWGTLKSNYEWTSERVLLRNAQGDITAGAQLLYKVLPLHLGCMAYLPMGPLITAQADATALWQMIDRASQARSARFLKWEPGIVGTDDRSNYSALGFSESRQTIQPPRTVIIEIASTEETILARMNQGTRRKIRQSYKKDVHYFHAQREDMAIFNRLMKTTGNRNEFGVHEPAYYELAYELFVPSGDATVIIAEHEGDPLAAIMVFAVNDTAWYLYGASSDQKRNLMASYGVQWEAIKWAKERGCQYYDMWGIPDTDEATLEDQFQERSDGLWGVYGFKRGWGGEIVRAEGAWDKPYNKLVYLAYQSALKLRNN